MSCSVLSLPLAVGYIVASMISKDAEKKYLDKLVEDSVVENLDIETNDEVFYIKADTCEDKQFDTPFVDKNVLLKTLREHGLEIIFENDYSVEASIMAYSFRFSRDDILQPFSLNVKSNKDSNVEDTVNEINKEYSLNVQEQSYLNIVNNLKNNNMQIEKEEVLEDNTVVLTINVE